MSLYKGPEVKLEKIEEENVKNVLLAVYSHDGITYKIKMPDVESAEQLKRFITVIYLAGTRTGKKEVIDAVSHSLRYFVKL